MAQVRGQYRALSREKKEQSLHSLTQKISLVAEELVGSQKMLCFMEFDIQRTVHRDIFL